MEGRRIENTATYVYLFAMADNTGNGFRRGLVDDRTQVQNHKSGNWTKRDTETGRFMDLLVEVLLQSWGEPALSLRVAEETIEGVRVFSIADGAFLICLEEEVTLEFIRALAARKPDRVVLRESAFASNDPLKTNAVQTFKSQGVTSLKVV